MFDRLEEVRSVARARAVEDFEFFVGRVLGLSFDPVLLQNAQRCIEENLEVESGLEGALKLRFDDALRIWVALLRGECVEHSPSETFEWLWPEALRQNVAA